VNTHQNFHFSNFPRHAKTVKHREHKGLAGVRSYKLELRNWKDEKNKKKIKKILQIKNYSKSHLTNTKG